MNKKLKDITTEIRKINIKEQRQIAIIILASISCPIFNSFISISKLIYNLYKRKTHVFLYHLPHSQQ